MDAVSSEGGVEVDFDGWGVVILITGPQKAINSPTGVTIMAISGSAWDRIARAGYRGVYLSLSSWREMLDSNGIFPYTMSDPLIYALDEALNMIFGEGVENVLKRHEIAGRASWDAASSIGLEPFPSSIEHSSPTVTALLLPQRVDGERLRLHMWSKYGVMLAGSWGRLEGKILRIGHMGVQASRNHLILAYTSLARGLRNPGYPASLSKAVETVEQAFGRASTAWARGYVLIYLSVKYVLGIIWLGLKKASTLST